MFTTPGIHQLRSLKSTTSVEDNSSQSNVTAIAEMTAAITDLDTWRKQRENDALVLKQKLTAIENEKEIESTNNTNKEKVRKNLPLMVLYHLVFRAISEVLSGISECVGDFE